MTHPLFAKEAYGEDHVDTLAIGAVRYALGRQTYAVGQTCAAIRWAASELDAGTLHTIRRDIREAKAKQKVGAPFDEREWMELLSFLDGMVE